MTRPSDLSAREAEISALPIAHAVALRLRAGGAADELIATALGIDIDEIAVVIEIAEAKLAAELEARAEDHSVTGIRE